MLIPHTNIKLFYQFFTCIFVIRGFQFFQKQSIICFSLHSSSRIRFFYQLSIPIPFCHFSSFSHVQPSTTQNFPRDTKSPVLVAVRVFIENYISTHKSTALLVLRMPRHKGNTNRMSVKRSIDCTIPRWFVQGDYWSNKTRHTLKSRNLNIFCERFCSIRGNIQKLAQKFRLLIC